MLGFKKLRSRWWGFTMGCHIAMGDVMSFMFINSLCFMVNLNQPLEWLIEV